MACRSGCPTPGAHQTWGECARAASLRIAYCGVGGGDATVQKKLDSDLAAYKAARNEGIQPRSTKRKDVQRAVEISDRFGAAYQGA